MFGELLGVDIFQQQATVGAAAHHVVGDDLDGQPDTFAQILGHPDGVLDRIVENAGPPDVSVRIGQQGLASEDRGGPVEFAAALVVAAFGDHE